MRHQCERCGKQAFTTRAEAKRSARTLYPGQHFITYPCGTYWHYTSNPHRSWIIAQHGNITIRETDAATAGHYVAQRVQATGEGPTWAELLAAMGWPRNKTWIIQALTRHGWIVTGTQPRSMRPGVKASDWGTSGGTMVPVGAGQRGPETTVGTADTPQSERDTPASNLHRLPADVHPAGGEPGMV